MLAHAFPTSLHRSILAAFAVLAVGAAVQAAPASALEIPSGRPGETGSELPPYNCGGCSSTVSWEYRDSDGDDLQNGVELKGRAVVNGESVAFPPTDPDDADSDSDGLTDGAEVKTGRKELPRNYGGPLRLLRTNPRVWDTDGDGHSDGLEVKFTRTHPNYADTDRDGLTDGAEGFTHRTNARKADTDNDCRTDGREVREGTDPRAYTRVPFDACELLIIRQQVREMRVMVTQP